MIKTENILSFIKKTLKKRKYIYEDIQNLNFNNVFKKKEYKNINDALKNIKEKIQTQIDETDIIFYGSAMDYLKKNDISLAWSLGIVVDSGYDLKKLLDHKQLNSTFLATLLKQNNMNDQWKELEAEIKDEF